ncbi:MAG TPA: hypothetical protein VHE55_15260 [Fimbriimonadaceae bacterium]|nr:hypothetical protein [Fimbriimonadaceae bacterium]
MQGTDEVLTPQLVRLLDKYVEAMKRSNLKSVSKAEILESAMRDKLAAILDLLPDDEEDGPETWNDPIALKQKLDKLDDSFWTANYTREALLTDEIDDGKAMPADPELLKRLATETREEEEARLERIRRALSG